MKKWKMTNNSSFKRRTLIITAAGSSTRMGGGVKKEYISLGGETVLSKAAKAFLLSAQFSHIIITCPKDKCKQAEEVLFQDRELANLIADSKAKIFFIEGDSTRQASVFKALSFLKDALSQEENSKSIVLIHDGARPFVSKEIILNVIETVEKFGAACPAINVTDTQKRISSEGTIQEHLVRSSLRSVQTPQGFDLDEIFECHKKAELISKSTNKEFTDDTEIYDSFPELTDGKKVHITQGSIENIKITYPSDLQMNKVKQNRIGLGNDTHRLIEGRKFLLGGVEIPSEKGEEAHSDGDVLLHAITDALLGAAGLGDIGSYFPPEDAKWKDAASRELIQKCWNDVKAQGYSLVNLDCVVECEKPKLLPYRQKIIESIAEILSVEKERIFVKGKTGEKLDAVGEGKAVKASCICLLEK